MTLFHPLITTHRTLPLVIKKNVTDMSRMESNKDVVATPEVRIESNDTLMHVFNTINEEKESQIFIYKGVKFWREDYEFIMSYNEEAFLAGVVTDFDEFKEMLLDQKL